MAQIYKGESVTTGTSGSSIWIQAAKGRFEMQATSNADPVVITAENLLQNIRNGSTNRKIYSRTSTTITPIGNSCLFYNLGSGDTADAAATATLQRGIAEKHTIPAAGNSTIRALFGKIKITERSDTDDNEILNEVVLDHNDMTFPVFIEDKANIVITMEIVGNSLCQYSTT